MGAPGRASLILGALSYLLILCESLPAQAPEPAGEPRRSPAAPADSVAHPRDGDPPAAPVEPKDADRIELGGYTQVRWSEGGEHGSFLIRRARLVMKGELDGWLDVQLDVDLVDLAEQDEHGGSGALKDVLLDAHPLDALRVRAGQYKKPFLYEEDASTSDLMVLDRGLLSDHLRDLEYAGRDVGGEVRFTFAPGGLEARLTGLLMNGEGPNQGRWSDGRGDAILHLQLEHDRKGRPDLGVVAAGQWKSPPRDAPGGDEPATAYMLAGWLEWRGFEIDGEILEWSSDPGSGAGGRAPRGWGGRYTLAWISPKGIPGLHRMGLALRGEYLDPDRDRKGDGRALWTPTLTLFLHPDSRIRVASPIRWYQDPARPARHEWMVEWQMSY